MSDTPHPSDALAAAALATLVDTDTELDALSRHRCARALREEVARLRGIIDRNRDRHQALTARAAQAEADRDTYRRLFDQQVERAKQLELKLLALGRSSTGADVLNDLLRGAKR